MTGPNYDLALTLIDAAHALDPSHTTNPPSPAPIPYELHYANRMTHYLSLLRPAASPLLRIAVRAQHLRRWEIPRAAYPATKQGYLAWRAFLKRRQAELVKGICGECGVVEAEAEVVARLVRKEGLGKGRGGGDEGKEEKAEEEEEEVQILEDCACLVFLDDQFAAFERGMEEEKMLGILRKTWAKMGEGGRRLALEMEMSEQCRVLVGKALAG